MSLKTRLFALFAALSLTAAPVFAAPVAVSSGLHLSAPGSAPAAPWRGLSNLLLGGGIAVGITIRKDIGAIAQKFVTRAQAAAGDYKTGVANAGQTWESATAAAESNWEQGTQAAMTSKRFSKGVGGKAGKFQTNAVNLGSQRYGPGVANAQQAYQTGMAPVIAALSSLSLPVKGFRGSPQNQQRTNTVATALAALRANK